MRIHAHVLIAVCGVFTTSNALGDAPPLSSEEILATPAKAEFKIYSDNNQITSTGELLKVSDQKMDIINATVGFGKSYEVPWCREHTAEGQNLRIGFAPILVGQPLEKLLESLTEQSSDVVKWDIRYGRTILSFHRPDKTAAVDMLDREVRLESDASTLGSAMEALEAAYNTQYKDVPVILSLGCLNSEPETPLSTPLVQVLPEPITLRDAILRILDATGNYRATYGASVMQDPKDRSYIIVHVWRENCRDEFESAEEFKALRAGAADERERLADYFAASEKK